MPVFHPLMALIVLAAFFAIIAALAFATRLPAGRYIHMLWIVIPALVIGYQLWAGFVVPPDPLRTWKTPAWHPIIGMAQFLVPYTVAYLCWRAISSGSRRIGKTVAAALVAGATIASFAAGRTFNTTCVYFDYYNDVGEAWCPADWQAYTGAKPRIR